jgi:RecQ family ATP-dependent DNA helicase
VKLNAICKQYFGYKPREAQRTLIEASLHGKNIMGILPTGGGKSLVYGLSSVLRDKPTVVFSPLIALMQDQLDRFTKAGVPCARIASDMDESDALTAMRLFKKGMIKMLFVAPERLKNKEFVAAAQHVGIGCVCVDEAHVLAVSSRDFRPAYMAIKRFAKMFPDAPIMALTATADPDMEKDIARGLGMETYTRVVGSPRRENLKYTVTNELEAFRIPNMIRSAGDGAKLIYCSSRKTCEALAANLRGAGLRCGHYHAGMEKGERGAAMEAFMDGRTGVVVATSAFGMGVDKSNIRLVLHWHIPASIYDYVQGAGRGGRDGKDCQCVLNISKEGEKLANFFIRMANPKQEVYENLWDYLVQHVSLGNVLKTSETQLYRAAHLPDAVGGQAMSALRFMEYNKLIETVPGIKTYFLNIRNRAVAERYAAGNRKQMYVRGNQLIVSVDPTSDSDPVDEMVRAGAVWPSTPRAEVMIKRLQRRLTIGRHEIEEKLARDKDKLFDLYRFAGAKDKQGFIENAFTATNR